QQVARMSYVDFVRGVLLRGLGARHLVLGYNVRLGHERRGNRQRLAALGDKLGYELTIVPPVHSGNEVVSSTCIRHRLDAGDVEGAARLLGRPYTLQGTVIRGTGRGRVLGIPTANLELHPDKLVPANGVYVVRARVGSTRHGGALNIGVAPTFQAGGGRSVEVHLLDYTGDLYGSRVHLEVLRRLRDERRFDGPDALVDQVRRDIEAARAALEE
ncbi:MAG: bifunctional riboflavin kinase/FMN adenylyltransferase, partial [Candidatus Krumholzibacteriia bacterium]